MALGVLRWNKVVVISICCLTCQTGSVCFPVFAVDWYMSSILFAGVTTEYTPTLPSRGKKQLCFINMTNIYSMRVRYCRWNETDAKISVCIFYGYQFIRSERGLNPYHEIGVMHRERMLNPVTNWKYISLTFFSEFPRDWGKSSFFPDLSLSVVPLVCDRNCPYYRVAVDLPLFQKRDLK